MAKTALEVKEDLDHLVSKINIGASFFDARAISVMGTFGNDILSLQKEPELKTCSTCRHFGKYTLHVCDGGLNGCKLLHIQDSDRELGGCNKWETK